jgi:ribosomal protein S24E
MKTLTVRGIDPLLSQKLKKISKQEGKSINQLVLDAMKQHFGLEKEKKFTRIYHDLDHLYGSWSQEEYDLIQGKIDRERKIDDELWK